MKPLQKPFRFGFALLACAYVLACIVHAWSPKPVKEDPLPFMPGTQPDAGASELESISACTSCHDGYEDPVNPTQTWSGSMMAHAARDPLWIASLAVANQDAIWALGNPNGADLCVRCHSPKGWLAGRSDPPNMSLLNHEDKEGVTCAACHDMIDPITALGQPDVAPENPPVPALVANTQTVDLSLLDTHRLFDNVTPFLRADNFPYHYGDGSLPHYIESTGGQFFIDRVSRKMRRGPLTDPNAKHSWLYSRYHKSRQFCGTCHDVSNAVLANIDSPGTSERQAAGSYNHVERTFSEFMLSDFGQPGGAATSASFAQARGISHVGTCQHCHMPQTNGRAAKQGTLRSQIASHDLTGASVWMSRILASADINADASIRDDWNLNLFSGNNPKYPGATIETGGLAGNAQRLLDGADRARLNLTTAASISLVSEDSTRATIRIINHTGHKLISGYPEGRRMWLNVQFIDKEGNPLPEINGYQPLVISTDAQGDPVYVSGGTLAKTHEELIYEAKMRNPDLLPDEAHSFHFILGSSRYKDNRIPPRGFDVAGAAARICLPVWEGTMRADYFTPAEYQGGYDEVTFSKPDGAVSWVARLYYQSTSKEYITFLRDEINGSGNLTLASPTPSGEAQAYIAQTDPYFSQLKDWGNAIWDLWLHNQGAPPELMTVALGKPQPPRASRQPDGIHISFPTIQGCIYQVEASPDMSAGSWVEVGPAIIGDGSVHTSIDGSAANQSEVFYRVTIDYGTAP